MWSAVIFLAVVAGISASAETLQASGDLPESRIVSGWEAREGQFPYMLYLRGIRWTGDISACGASVIHRRWGLTSARCTAQRTVLMISAGSVNRLRPRVHFETSTYFTHTNYNDALQPITQPDDISLINFNRDLTFDNFIQPIRLQRSADMNRDYTDVVMSTSGWGTTFTCTELGCPTPEILNWVHLRGVSNFMCLLMFNSNYLVRATTICAGPFNVTSQSICSGDSGVPLTVLENDGVPTQLGIGSFVTQFGCHVGFPGGFTRTGHYHAWMREVTGINFDWTRAGEHPALDDVADLNADEDADFSDSFKY
ncbi:collagenase-like [Anticarsia gemmatalis]|uniref:collagenase-like n=1 Tax=Anticarsia gemmatalis TaxID=129554 RepID=UPI003F76CAC2